MDVLQLFIGFEKGGAEKYIINIVEKLKKRNVNFHIICDHKGNNHEKAEKICNDVQLIKMRNIFDIIAAYKIARFCRKNNIKIIHTHFLRENIIAVISKLFNPNVKVIWTNHLIYEKSRLLKWINRKFSKYVSKIICVSEAVKKATIDEGISPEKTVVIYNGVDTDLFKPTYTKDIKAELGINKNEIVLTTVARFYEVKGYDFLLEALKELKKFNFNFKAILVGDGSDLIRIKEKSKRLGLDDNIIFTGYREDIPLILTASDIYLSPSKSEAISFSILEALSCKVPVVATEVGGVPEIFNKGKCGILVPYGEAKRFAESIYDLYNNKVKYYEIQQNVRDIIINHFSSDNMVNMTYELYTNVINK